MTLIRQRARIRIPDGYVVHRRELDHTIINETVS